MPGIGLLNEKPLHASLKAWYSQPGDQLEVALDGFVIDIVRNDQLLEIQTGNFSSIKPKLTKLLGSHQVRLIYPIAQEKWIIKLAKEEGQISHRRKSPKRGRMEDVFREMVSLPLLASHLNFSLEVLLIKEEEVRRHHDKRRWRRRGWCTEERRLLEVVDQRLFATSADWLGFLPQGLELFTTQDLAEAATMRRDLAQKMVYFLRKASLIELMGKRGRANLYRVSGA
ncbi:hypothetical protein [Leptothoe sp. PORK10 BA2]|uniref:hypothetical protein n=1 Tax=Leptothoe sp. PORK10 BA2 TaxID=3110254 RepID=UPI002B20A1F4|nr:hypothetical protein [Leptothoe sp. PORK10 BA2]MEA5466293.1 hypothetical protein [Leptothoe sp. PORK10 BA2]